MNSYEYQNAVLGSSLSANAKLTALAISYHYNWKEATASFPSVATLVKRTSLSRATIHRSKNELVSQGYLLSTRRFNDSNLYLPVIPPQSQTDTWVVSEGRTNNEYNNELNNEKKDSNESLDIIIDLNQGEITPLDTIWEVFEDGKKDNRRRPSGRGNQTLGRGNRKSGRNDYSDAEEPRTSEELNNTRSAEW